MNQEEKNLSIYNIEEFYCSRMEYLVNEERFDDSHSIFEEFVVDGDEPEEYLFMTYHENIH